MSTSYNDRHHFVSETKRLHKIITAVEQNAWNRKEAYDYYNSKLADLDEELKTIQDECKHEYQDYYPDASGNNDDSTVCMICGKDL